MSEKINVMLVDDHHAFRQSLALFFQMTSTIAVVAEASTGQDALSLYKLFKPQVILMDIDLPGMDGIQTTQAILELNPEVHIIALTSLLEADIVQGAFRAGMKSYLLKTATLDEIAAAIQSAYDGHPTISREVTGLLIKLATQSKNEHNLTARELDVLGLMTKGLTNPEIADKLMLSRHSVKGYVSTVLGKLGVTNRAEAIALALKQHLVD